MRFVVHSLLLCLGFCSEFASNSFGSETIVVGNDDRVVVSTDRQNIPEFYRGVVDAIGFIDKGCTVVHIGNNLVLTAGHCIKNGREFRRIENADCSMRGDLSAIFGYIGDSNKVIHAKCLKIVLAEYQAATVDYAVLELSQAPSRKLDVDLRKPDEHAELTFFSHPHQSPLTWSGYCSVEEFTEEEAEKVGINYKKKAYFKHLCDSDKGSSGAPLIDAETKRIVGIHSGGQLNINSNFALFLGATDLANTLKQYRSGD